MKTFTQAEFNALPVADGIRECPTGDYSQMRAFAAGCSFAARCSFAAWCKATADIFWSFPSIPPFKIQGRILPTEECRAHWAERLGLPLRGCYEEITEKINPQIPKLLRQKKWTKWERRILESWKSKPCPCTGLAARSGKEERC